MNKHNFKELSILRRSDQRGKTVKVLTLESTLTIRKVIEYKSRLKEPFNLLRKDA